MTPMNIGDAAAAAGVTPKMIRHYESLGLIPAAERTDAGYRLYTGREVEMLRFIRQSRALGFSIPQINELLSLWRDEHRESRAVKEVANRQLAELEERQRELDAMRATLAGMVAACAGNEQAGCAILETLSSAAAAKAQPECHRTASGLKQVKAGSSAPRSRPPQRAKAAPTPAPAAAGHAGLMVWSRSFGAT
jgi:MerR family copper efflux transcriptional regulator